MTPKRELSYFERQWLAIDRDRRRERITTEKGLCFICGKNPVRELMPGLTTMTCSDECQRRYLPPTMERK